jgi:hypothetical protein
MRTTFILLIQYQFTDAGHGFNDTEEHESKYSKIIDSNRRLIENDRGEKQRLIHQIWFLMSVSLILRRGTHQTIYASNCVLARR